ncbi:MAG: cell division protein FtsQ/DivIB [Candidatus Binataceae bacterium]
MVAKKKSKGGAQWGWRLAGILLCAFFALGVITGLSRPGHVLGERIRRVVGFWSHAVHSSGMAGDLAPRPANGLAAILPRAAVAPVALVERSDGFYTLNPGGELRGPVSPAAVGDLPILSGAGVNDAHGEKLLQYAAAMVRAEADLSELVSEMRVDDDQTATLFLERSRTSIIFQLDDAGVELAHAARVMHLWRGHDQLVASVDVTSPGQAVVEFRATNSAAADHHRLRKIALAGRRGARPRKFGGEGIVR